MLLLRCRCRSCYGQDFKTFVKEKNWRDSHNFSCLIVQPQLKWKFPYDMIKKSTSLYSHFSKFLVVSIFMNWIFQFRYHFSSLSLKLKSSYSYVEDRAKYSDSSFFLQFSRKLWINVHTLHISYRVSNFHFVKSKSLYLKD